MVGTTKGLGMIFAVYFVVFVALKRGGVL